MFSFDFQVDHDILEPWKDAIVQSPQTTRVFIQGTILGDIKQQVDAVDRYPPLPKYPIEWTSEKQRRYYFAVVADRDPDGNIIAYQRTGTFFDDVLVELDNNELNLSITNPNPVARFVLAPDQQKFHANTGWLDPTGNYLEILLIAQDRIIDAYIDIIDWKNLA